MSDTHTKRVEAMLLLGPTGSGKTPLGETIEQCGLWDEMYHHFDFGANLRERVTTNQADEYLSRDDLDFLAQVLTSGALLEDRHFPIAQRVLESFLASKGNTTGRLLLNGLPRHLGQAEALESIVEVKHVVHLNCSPETVVARIKINTGGDRTNRQDDDLESIRRKLNIYEQRTTPLLNYYRQRGARLESLEVGISTTAKDMWRILSERRVSP